MTAVSTIFEIKEKRKANSKHIMFEMYLKTSGEFSEDTLSPEQWDNVALISKGRRYDQMVAWDNSDKKNKTIHLGKWNDGVVEGQC